MAPREFPILADPGQPFFEISDVLILHLQAIIEAIHPEKIILFGSYAYGVPRQDSDIDLLVIRRNIESELQSNLEIRRAMRSVPGIPPAFTLISKSPERLAARLAEGSPFLQEIVDRGIELYAA